MNRSAMLKFEGLEGIDLESKEVYETSDIDDSFDLNVDTETRRDSISEEPIDVSENRNIFEKNIIDAHVTDFSDRIDRLGSYETYTVKETTQNKLDRIRKELLELENSLEEDESEIEDPVELAKLKELFWKLNVKTKDRPIVKLNLPKFVNDATTEVTPALKREIDPELIESLDKKLSHIEKLLGSDLKPDTSIQATINDIFRKLKLLTNDEEELNRIIEVVEEVNLKLERSIAVRRSVETHNTVKEDAKIHEIFTNFQNVQETTETVPFLIKRLKTLNDLHLQTASSVASVSELDSHINELKDDFQNWEKSLSTLESKLENLNEEFHKNKDHILSNFTP